MFDFVRQHTKIMMGVMFLLIIPSFVFFGIQGYGDFRASGEVVASVAGQDITKAEWDDAHRREVERMRPQMPNLDASMFDTPQARYSALERLVQQRVLQAAADKSRLVTGDQRLARELQENPTIAALRKPDGKLDVEGYRQLLSTQGMTPEAFESRMRAELSARHPGEIIVACDVRERKVTTRGWAHTLPLDILDVVEELNALPLGGLLVTAVHREGQMQGTDLPLMEDVAESSNFPVFASGGVATMQDLRALEHRGMAGVVIGMALYTGALDPVVVAGEFCE